MTEPSEWAVRDERAGKQTGFGSEEQLALAAYNALIDKARESGKVGEFSLLKDGALVSRAFVPGRGETG